MVLEYKNLQNWLILGVNVGIYTYSSTMDINVHIWIYFRRQAYAQNLPAFNPLSLPAGQVGRSFGYGGDLHSSTGLGPGGSDAGLMTWSGMVVMWVKYNDLTDRLHRR